MQSKVNQLASLGVLCLMFGYIACIPPSSNCSAPASYEINLSVQPVGYLYQNGTGLDVVLKFKSSTSFNATFKLDRIQHDACYQCHSEFNLTKAQCDHGFWASMNTTCETLDAPRVEPCKRVAYNWYSAINDIEAYMPTGSPAWCTNDAWVDDCLVEV